MENNQPSPAPKTPVNQHVPGASTKLNRSVVVTGYPPYTTASELENAFVHLGSVTVENFSHQSGTLVFSNSNSANKALRASGKIVLYGHFIKVTRGQPSPRPKNEKKENAAKGRFPQSADKGVTIEPSTIDLSGDFHQQLAELLAAVRLSQEEVAVLTYLYADVEHVLQETWPGSTVIPFGSITTGLAIKGSDADCFVDVPAEYRRGETLFVNKAKKILQRHKGVFRDIFCIPQANTPIVKFFHVPTETACDLSFKSPIGTRNSQLIAFLIHADPRILPVTVFIKYWAKVCGIAGSRRMSNYALTMMIIFYFQQVSILPAVKLLQKDRIYDNIVDYWNTGFMCRYDMLPMTSTVSNTTALPGLIGGFFDYYSKFNFNDAVVSPFLGQPILKSQFNTPNSLPSDFDLYKQNVAENLTRPLRVECAICIQSPFEQSHNVASAISAHSADEMKAFLSFAAKAYDEEKTKECKDLLKKILLEKPILPKKRPKLPVYRMTIAESLLSKIRDDDWQSVVRKLVFQIFEQVLKLKLEQLESIDEPNYQNKRTLTDEKEKYSSTLNKTIWIRERFTKLYSMMKNLSFFEKQTRITEEIIRVDKNMLNIKFQLILSFSCQKRSVTIAVKVLEQNEKIPIFKTFGSFFINFVSACFKESLLNGDPTAKIDLEDSQEIVEKNCHLVEESATDSEEDGSADNETPKVDDVEKSLEIPDQ